MIVFAGEQRLGFQLGDVILRGVEFAVEFFEEVDALIGVGLFLREVDVGFDVGGDRRELVIRRDLVFGTLAVAQDALGFFLIVPEIRIRDALFEGLQAFAILWSVKDSSG
jgi:hypothetical protein